MEIQTKERLTGAIVLVVLVVALVPELLSGRKTDSAQTATSAGEGSDAAPLRSYTIDLDSSATQPPASSGARPSGQPQAELAAPPANLESSGVPSAAPVPPAQASTPAAAVTLPVPDVAAARAPTRTLTPTTTPTLAPTPAAPVRAKAGEFVVQIGTFSNRDNAERLARQLSGKGYSAYVAPVKGGKRDLYRVRVGPSASRDAATSLAARLKAAGHAGAVVPAG